MKFEDSFLFAKPVKTAYIEEYDETVHWLNGTVRQHNTIMKLVANEKTRQEGWLKAVYDLACDEKGSLLFHGHVSQKVFIEKIDHAKARTFGGLILGISSGDEKDESEFTSDVNQLVKNSGKDSQATSS